MPHRLLDSEGAAIGGFTTLGINGLIQVYEAITMEDINNVLEFGLAIGGGLFLWYKINGQKLDNESKRLDNEKKRKEL